MKTVDEIIELIKASSKTLYVLCGLPYSGKTYLAEKILKNTSCVYVSIDNILKELGYDWDSNKLPDETGWKEVINLSYQKSKDALICSDNVLYDSTNHTKASRDILRNVAHESGSEFKIIYIDVSVDVVSQRWEENKASRKRFVLDKNLLDMTIDALEVPSDNENPWILKCNN